MKLEDIKIFSIVTAILLSIFLMGAYQLHIIHYTLSIQSEIIGCPGIEEYYTNTSFYNDYSHLVNYIGTVCDNDDNAETFSSMLFLNNFDDVKNCPKTMDCEDISHMINCLADKYEVECEFYTILGVNVQGHRGIKCLMDGEWEDLY